MKIQWAYIFIIPILLFGCSKNDEGADDKLSDLQWAYLRLPPEKSEVIWVNSTSFDTTNVGDLKIASKMEQEMKGMLWNPHYAYMVEDGKKDIVAKQSSKVVVAISSYSNSTYSHLPSGNRMSVLRQDNTFSYFDIDLYQSEIVKTIGGSTFLHAKYSIYKKDTLWFDDINGILGWSEYNATSQTSKIIYRKF